MSLQINQHSASQILGAWDAVARTLRKQTAWFTLLRLAAQPDWCAVYAIAAPNGKSRSSTRQFLKRMAARGLVELRRTHKRWQDGEPVLHYRLTPAGFAFLSTGRVPETEKQEA